MLLAAIALGIAFADTTKPADIGKARQAEASVGIPPTDNFNHTDASVRAYYRCYFTGPLELPSSYDKLRLREGTEQGCPVDSRKFDVFFYRIESVASGHAPVTESLSQATSERVAMVVPHEDFHDAVKNLPDRIGEAAATLAGFLAADTAAQSGSEPAGGDAALFLRKSELINRYFNLLGDLYQRFRSGAVSRSEALAGKSRLFADLTKACAAIEPAPRSFNRCVSAPNNAGLAFDYTYTAFYPLLYRVYLACGSNPSCAIKAMEGAPQSRSEARVVAYLEAFIAARQ
jgi:hypothetical protein